MVNRLDIAVGVALIVFLVTVVYGLVGVAQEKGTSETNNGVIPILDQKEYKNLETATDFNA